MSEEILYTSAPQGLKPGSFGFCTVAATAGLSATLAQRLESLSGYRHVYPPGHPRAGCNPVNFAHLILSVGGRRLHVLSRIADAGLDYSHRTNKLAHHVVLDAAERVPAGPAWVLAQPGFCETEFTGSPRILPAGRKPPVGELPLRPCSWWEKMTGDAGWAGVLARHTVEQKQLAYLIFPEGVDVLPLLVEAQALLPPDLRWEVTFSTYFTRLPPGVDCLWRCVLAGTPEAGLAKTARPALVLDLTQPLGAAPSDPWVEAARTGQPPPSPTGNAAQPVPGESLAPLGIAPWTTQLEMDLHEGPPKPLLPATLPDNDWDSRPALPPAPPPPLASRRGLVWAALAASFLLGIFLGGSGTLVAVRWHESSSTLSDNVPLAQALTKGDVNNQSSPTAPRKTAPEKSSPQPPSSDYHSRELDRAVATAADENRSESGQSTSRPSMPTDDAGPSSGVDKQPPQQQSGPQEKPTDRPRSKPETDPSPPSNRPPTQEGLVAALPAIGSFSSDNNRISSQDITFTVIDQLPDSVTMESLRPALFPASEDIKMSRHEEEDAYVIKHFGSASIEIARLSLKVADTKKLVCALRSNTGAATNRLMKHILLITIEDKTVPLRLSQPVRRPPFILRHRTTPEKISVDLSDTQPGDLRLVLRSDHKNINGIFASKTDHKISVQANLNDEKIRSNELSWCSNEDPSLRFVVTMDVERGSANEITFLSSYAYEDKSFELKKLLGWFCRTDSKNQLGYEQKLETLRTGIKLFHDGQRLVSETQQNDGKHKDQGSQRQKERFLNEVNEWMKKLAADSKQQGTSPSPKNRGSSVPNRPIEEVTKSIELHILKWVGLSGNISLSVLEEILNAVVSQKAMFVDSDDNAPKIEMDICRPISCNYNNQDFIVLLPLVQFGGTEYRLPVMQLKEGTAGDPGDQNPKGANIPRQ